MTIRQNAHLTFKENLSAGRHGWLRLTPAYSFRLVAESLAGAESGAVVFDPFSGSGTTGLHAAQRGFDAVLTDINPFLVWFGRVKTRNYSPEVIQEAEAKLKEVVQAAKGIVGSNELWTPSIFKIERWWASPALEGLKAVRAALDQHEDGSSSTDLLLVALCRAVISLSAVAFNHQSMSFQKFSEPSVRLFEPRLLDAMDVFKRYREEAEHVLATAAPELIGNVRVLHGDARSLRGMSADSVDILYTSPPYANRVSYIRELRPYMYWLRFLTDARQAGDLDWEAIGGTWGIATSRLADWSSGQDLPLGDDFKITLGRIRTGGYQSGDLLAKYIEKYFHDMWEHFHAAYRTVSSGGRVVYIVGNSSFFGHLVPTEEWYAKLLRQAGFDNVEIRTLRKRNSKASLYEFAVTGSKV